MMLKTKLFIGKTMAKKFYGDAMKSMKALSGKTITKAKGLKSKASSKISSFKAKKAQYYKDVDMEELMDGAFDGIMEKLDPPSVFISAKDQKNIDEMFQGEFQGIGIEFDILNKYITVIAPVVGAPSERAGILPGDWIIELDGESAYNISRDDVFKKLRGKKGTKVDLKIGRSGTENFDIVIIRDDIPLYSVRASTMLNDEVGYTWLTRFSNKSGQEVRKAVESLLNQGMKKLILDLRSNSGGILDQAAEVANIFITDRDTLVYTKGKNKNSEQVFMASPRKGNDNFSLIVLIWFSILFFNT